MAKADTILGPGTDLIICLLCVTLLFASYAVDRYVETLDQLSSANDVIEGMTPPDDAPSPEEMAETIRELQARLAAETAARERLQQALDAVPDSAIAGVELPPGHDPGKAVRDVSNKNISRVYIVNRDGAKHLYYKPFGGRERNPVTRERLHQLLQVEQRRFGTDLAVEIITDGPVYVEEKKCVECEFWQYDYYEFNDAYCRGISRCSDLQVP